LPSKLISDETNKKVLSPWPEKLNVPNSPPNPFCTKTGGEGFLSRVAWAATPTTLASKANMQMIVTSILL
jgi:hypothetical protein